MAVVMNNPGTAQPRNATTGSAINVKTGWSQPKYVDPSDSIGNIQATAAQGADMRGQVKALDKAGFSRGKGQNYAASIGSVKAAQEGNAMAAGAQLEADQMNAQAKTDFEFGQAMEGQKLARIQHEMTNADFNLANAQQQAANKLYQATLQGKERITAAYV